MNWARDQLGNLIVASGKNHFSYGLRCPTCDEPVFLRTGTLRRPHFAHYSRNAKPGCDLYHPYSSQTNLTPLHPLSVTKLKSSGASPLRGGLCLIERGEASVQIYLRLPRLVSAEGVSGTIEVKTAVGSKSFNASHLLRKQFVPLVPANPIAIVSGSAELLGVARSISQELAALEESFIIFRSPEDGGRLLSPGEPVEMGATYCILTRRVLADPPRDSIIALKSKARIRDWYLTYIILQEEEILSFTAISEAVYRYLGRPLRPPQGRIWPLVPAPHHFDWDGTLVYPKDANRILLLRTRPGEATVASFDDRETCDLLHWDNDRRGVFVCPSEGEFAVYLENREQFRIRFDDCEMFSPGGIRVECNANTFDLTEEPPTELLSHLEQGHFQIICPTERVAQSMNADIKLWTRAGRVFERTLKPGAHDFIAKNFGSLRFVKKVDPVRQSAALTKTWSWLEGVARSRGLSVERFESSAIQTPPYTHNSAENSDAAWLQVYFRAFKERLT